MQNNINLNNKSLLVDESLFSTANGYIGVRGNFEEGYPSNYDSIRGTYINGFYDDVDIEYGESAYGFPKTAQKMLNVPDAQGIIVEIDGEEFSLFEGKVLNKHRKLDMNDGYSSRTIEWRSDKGHHFLFEYRRMTSFEQLELMIFELSIKSINYDGIIKIKSTLNPEVCNYFNPDDPRVASGHSKLLRTVKVHVDQNIGQVVCETKRSEKKLAVTVSHDKEFELDTESFLIQATRSESIKSSETLTMRKFVVFTDSIRHSDIVEEGLAILSKAIEYGRDYWFQKQRDYLDEFWKFSQIEIEGDSKTESAVKYSMYQLLSSAGKDPNSNISAKGLSGEGYEGHYFWDTEIYMLPLFTLSAPKVAKNLLEFRFSTLDQARARAKEMGHQIGAKIPWRTISGTECSAYFPAGSAQYHINADVAFSNIQYYLATNDLKYIIEYGFEVIYETARLWLDIGHFDKNGNFRIDAVTGPDEYTAIVNNNYYTNSMAKYHLQWTVELLNKIKKQDVNAYEELKSLLTINEEEIESMLSASEKMYLPFDEEYGINPQDDSFMNKAEWDFENTPKDSYPLLLNYHPLTIYRHKVLKQPDTVLSHFLLDDVSLDIIKNSYEYYEKLTTHDSSLSPCVYSMMASRINDPEKAYEYFMKTINLDIDNLHGNTKDGLHIANAGGVYMSMVYGFGGLRIKSNGIHIRPTKPKEWKSYAFRLNIQGRLLRIEVGKTLRLESTEPLKIHIDGKLYRINGNLEVKYNGNH